MALTSSYVVLVPTKSFIQSQTQSPFTKPHQPSFLRSTLRPISVVHAANPVAGKTQKAIPAKWAVESWRSKKAFQLPEYPNREELDSVLKTLEAFPPIVFAGEARSLEERLGEAAMGNAFLLQSGDCAESFKEFNANNIHDTFRILLQMSDVLMFGS